MSISCKELIAKTTVHPRYTLHTHTEFCDGRSSIAEIVDEAIIRGMDMIGFTPHSPIHHTSSCNMTFESVPQYLAKLHEHKNLEQKSGLEILAGMEIDYMGKDWGAHSDYFTQLPIDYSISSIHFIPAQDGTMIDIDGRYERFALNMHKYFHDDIDYVVKTFLQRTLEMIDAGGFNIIGHFDKIAMNGSQYCRGLEEKQWYLDSISLIINEIAARDIIVEINTKAYELHGRFFPNVNWWDDLKDKGIPVIVNSDAHYREKLESGIREALKFLS